MPWLRWAFNRLIKCPKCKNLVPDAKFCIECGHQLKED